MTGAADLTTATTVAGLGSSDRRRRESPARREQRDRTRHRLLTAATEVVSELDSWDWKALTFKAVAERAGVSERTVYRHFGSERLLREAVVGRLREDAGVSLDAVDLDNLADVARRVFAATSSFAASRPVDEAEEFTQARRDRHDAVLRAVSGSVDWDDRECARAAGVLDVLWEPRPYEHLVAEWQLSEDDAADTMDWVIGLVVDAIRADNRPTSIVQDSISRRRAVGREGARGRRA